MVNVVCVGTRDRLYIGADLQSMKSLDIILDLSHNKQRQTVLGVYHAAGNVEHQPCCCCFCSTSSININN